MTMRLPMFAIAAVICATSPAYALDITTCGQAVPDNDTGVLQADLDCSSNPAEVVVTLGSRATLDMNGHAIIARYIGVSCASERGVQRCAVGGHGVAPAGVGDISGGSYGIVSSDSRLTISDVNVHDVLIQGITAHKLEVTNVAVNHSEANGIVAYRSIRATNVVVSDNEYTGMDAAKVTGTNVTASDNGYSGVSCRKCRLSGLIATNNGDTDIPAGAGGGVQGVTVRLTDSVLTGNVVDGVPVDIDSYERGRRNFERSFAQSPGLGLMSTGTNLHELTPVGGVFQGARRGAHPEAPEAGAATLGYVISIIGAAASRVCAEVRVPHLGVWAGLLAIA